MTELTTESASSVVRWRPGRRGDWNDTAIPYPSGATIPALFQARAKTSPDAVALAADRERITYAELDWRSDRVASRLRPLLDGPESVVAFCLERSPAQIVTILGILKAGACYLPLDRANPAARNRFLLRDTNAVALVTDHLTASDFAWAELHRLNVKDLERECARHDPIREIHGLSARSLAYIAYTSGSTGEPKGVMVEHRSVVRLVMEQCYASFGPDRVFLQLAPVAFDASTFEIWAPLLHGGTLVIAPEGPLDFNALARLIESQGVTTIWLTTGLFNGVIEACPSALAGVGEILTGGETISPRHVRLAFCTLGTSVRISNMYGPTECTTFACSHLIDPDNPAPGGAIPIGRPIANTTAYVLDEKRREVPIGMRGELYLGGDGVARGYWNRPELTEKRFLPDPFATIPGGRMYRTGDMARRLENGSLEFLGRLDGQVKVRGFRIELGEIEAALATFPGVRQCVVVPREDHPGTTRLIAYLAADDVDEQAIQTRLAGSLPYYMIPSAVVRLDKLPLNSNGKIDRTALPAPACDPEKTFTPPRDSTEQTIAEIWREILGLGRVSIDDDFFRLGGNSLLAARVVARLSAVMGVIVTVRELFERPTIAGLGAAISRRARETPDRIDPVPDVPTQLPSFGQQRLWFIDQLEGKRLSAYNIATATRLSGILEPKALRLSLEDIVGRHETLRTTFTVCDGRMVAKIQPPRPLELPIHDLSHLRDEAASAETDRLIRIEADQPFDLSADGLLRASLLRIHERLNILVLTVHHIAADGWSLGVLFGELAAAYSARIKGHVPRLPALSTRYADFAAWQRRRLDEGRHARSLSYWRERLWGLEPLELPADRARPASPSYRGASLTLMLPASLTAGLRRLAVESGATLHMVLLSAFLFELARLTGRHDVAVGVPYSGRTRLELEALVGFFVNTVVIRVDLSGSPTFRDLVNRVREASLAAHENQELPFDRLVEDLRPERSRTQNPLVQFLFQLVELSELDLSGVGIATRALPDPLPRVRFDLELLIEPRDDSLVATFRYATDLFDPATIERFAGLYRAAVEWAVARPDQPLDDARLIAERELQRLLVDWNDTAVEIPSDITVHGLIARRARELPDRVAVSFGDAALSYGALNSRANRLARHLQSAGVGPDVTVGLCVGRSIDMLVAILAVLKAGGAYVPLDPDQPTERLSSILADVSARLIITESKLEAKLGAVTVPRFRLDRDWTIVAHLDDVDLPEVASPADLAYVIFTSGSTGVPKGVSISRRALVGFMMAMAEKPGLRDDDALLAVTTISFDIAVLELLLPLTVGARVVIGAKEIATSGTQLIEMLETAGITVMQATPATWNLLLEAGWKGSPHLKILCGGESMSRGLANSLLDRCESLWNLYGPTETTVWSTLTRVERGTEIVSIGRPSANWRAYVLDHRREPVPIGVPGELFLGGVGVARGYWGRPDLTAERFPADPFSPLPGARMYRTGDQARWRHDGTLEFLGRLDHQVKIRGFRIEPGEIENAIARFAGVPRSVVVAREIGPADTRLVAYVVPASVDPSALRSHLARGLPDYMIPSSFVCMDEFPLTSSGKVDRKRLPLPIVVDKGVEPSVAPHTPVEIALAEIFRELLGAHRIGIHDDFFRLGGHSILAIRLMARVKDLFGVTLPLSTLLRAPTVSQLAAAVVSGDESSSTTVVKLESGDLAPPLFCFPGSYGRERMLLGHGLMLAALSRQIGAGFPFYGVTIGALPRDLDPNMLIEFAAERAVADIQAHRPSGPYLLGGFSLGGLVAVEVARKLLASGEKVALLALLDVYGPGFPRNRGAAEQCRALFAELWNHSATSRMRYLNKKVRRKLEHMPGVKKPEPPDPDRVVGVRDAIRMHLKRLESYPGRIHLFRAATNPKSVNTDSKIRPTAGARLLMEASK